MPSGWTRRGLCSSLRPQSASPGGVAERLNAPVLKTGVLSRGPWVRIPPPPPEMGHYVFGMRTHGPHDKWVRQLCGAKLDTGASATVIPSPRGMSNAPALLTIPPPPPIRPPSTKDNAHRHARCRRTVGVRAMPETARHESHSAGDARGNPLRHPRRRPAQEEGRGRDVNPLTSTQRVTSGAKAGIDHRRRAGGNVHGVSSR